MNQSHSLDPGLRSAALEATRAVVRGMAVRRRWTRRAVVAGSYAAGLLTAWIGIAWVERPAAPPDPARPGPIAAAIAPPVGSTPSTRVAFPADDDPDALRRRVASARPDEQHRLLRRAGDLYLSRRDDFDAALRCYAQALEVWPPTDPLELTATDPWVWRELVAARDLSTRN
jgi:hypothetical protein